MPKRNLILVVALLAAAAALVSLAKKPHPQPGPLARTEELIKDSYYQKVDAEKLRRGAVEGMLSKLDPFSRYIPPGKAVAIEQRLQGWESGVGLRLEIADGQVLVIGPIKGSPADYANLYSGDRIVAVDDAPVAGLDLTEVYRRLSGRAGATLKLTVFRAAGGEEELALTRRRFRIETLTGLYRDSTREWMHVVDPAHGIAYVRVREFVFDTAERFQQCLRALEHFDAVVIDLRDNPGGPLESAVAVSNLFLEKGTIVSVVSRKEPTLKYEATPDGTYPQRIPLVLLVNGETASAAELFVGALQLHDRAVLVGTRTHGKGTLQTLKDLPGSLGQINLTTAEFRIAGTRAITRRRGAETWGVDPHEQVDLLPLYAERLRRLRVQAEVHRPPPGTLASVTAEGPGGLAEQILKLDLQLARAMEILRTPGEYRSILRRAAAVRAAQRPPPGRTAPS